MSKKNERPRTARKHESLRRVVSLAVLALVAIVAGYYGYVHMWRGYEAEKPPGAEVPSREVQVYFSNRNKDPQGLHCERVYPVTRQIAGGSGVIDATLQELLQGPSAEEQARGYFTNINEGVRIRSIELVGGEAVVDFSARLQEAVGGSCRVQAIRAQITRTVAQFSSVDTVIISVEGREVGILQP